MATYYKHAKVNRWKGTLDEIAELSAAVSREVELRTSKAPPYESRVEGPALHAEFDDVQEMKRAIRVEDLKTLQKLSVTVGEWAEHTPLSASITFSRVAGEPAASVQTRGTDRVQVEGLLSAKITDGVILDFDAEGILVGIDLQRASKCADIERLIVSRLHFTSWKPLDGVFSPHRSEPSFRVPTAG